MMADVNSNHEGPGRYHLLLSIDGRPTQHGWWGSEAVARRKLSRWIGEYGSKPDAQITLTDEEAGEQLAVWPDGPGIVSGQS
jgi:hypothetical protein